MRTLQGKSISHKTLETHETFHWSTSSDARWNFERVQFFGNMFSGERDSVEVLTFKFSAVTGERELKTKGRKKDSLQHVEREGYGGPLGCERSPEICLETWTPKPVPAHPTMERGWPHMSKLPIGSPNDMMGFGVVGVMKTKQMAA